MYPLERGVPLYSRSVVTVIQLEVVNSQIHKIGGSRVSVAHRPIRGRASVRNQFNFAKVEANDYGGLSRAFLASLVGVQLDSRLLAFQSS